MKDLERTHKGKWRNNGAERKFFQRRSVIIRFLEAQQDHQIQDVIARLDELRARVSLSLNQLSEKMSKNNFQL